MDTNSDRIYTLHLFAGAGGGILADLLLGHTPVGAVEIEEYPRKVLLARQLDGILPRFPIWDDVCTFRIDNPDTSAFIERLKAIRNNLCICGGFPCQDISIAGKGAGLEGERSGLWTEFKRIIGEIRPRRVFVENSPMLTIRGLGTVLGELATLGYDAQWGVLGAVDAGAPHQRDRIWIMAYPNSDGFTQSSFRRGTFQTTRKQQAWQNNAQHFAGTSCISSSETDVANPYSKRGCGRDTRREDAMDANSGGQEWLSNTSAISWWEIDPADISDPEVLYAQGLYNRSRKIEPRRSDKCDGENDKNWSTQSDVGRVAYGVAARVDRLKAIGNGQCPQVAALAWQTLSGIDNR